MYSCISISNYAWFEGMLFARRVLAVSWEASLEVLSVLLGGKNPHGITASFSLLLGGKEEGRRAREAICTSLDSLQRAARLACSLGRCFLSVRSPVYHI